MKKKRGSKGSFKTEKHNEDHLVADMDADSDFINMENDADLDENEHYDYKLDAATSTALRDRGIDAVLPSKSPVPKPVLGRVKVKLKSSRPLEVQHTYSDLQSEIDTSQSKLVLSGQKPNTDIKEDSAYSDGLTSDLQTTSAKSPHKSGSIMIISKGIDKCTNKQFSSEMMLTDRGFMLSDNEKAVDSPASTKVHGSATGFPFQDSCYNDKEMNDALSVIKKVMKMDAAEPFNTPVDPVALGIPDYFDVIDTPMDFGTICKNIEHRKKYSSSEDVFRDVQLIWDNCNKYNNKGDYIIDLMKRVKKNFIKYWLAAGLYWKTPVLGAIEAADGEENKHVQQEQSHQKGKISKYKRRRFGTNHHKSGCLCAVCVVRRQKKEREGNATVAGNLMTIIDPNTIMVPSGEEGFHIGNHESEHSSMSLSQSASGHFVVESEEPEQGETDGPEFHNIMEETLFEREEFVDNDALNHDINHPSTLPSTLTERELDGLDFEVGLEGHKSALNDHAEIYDAKDQARKVQEQAEFLNQKNFYEDPFREENPSIMQICKTVFSRDCTSLWNGPHSLSHQLGASSARTSSLDAAILSIFKR